MKLLRMTATFGCLDGAALELHEGLNLLTLPNESGKSTWAAFLLAMFYGIDTARRASREYLPEKLRYQPWSGKAMEGTVELEHGGRRIVLQRTSLRGRPMSDFRAYDKETGLALEELTGENCGMYFFGVEREVLRRSGLICGSQLAVTEDRELAGRLENLAASGDLADSYPAAAARLRQWKNRCRYHQNGLLPEAENRLAAAQRQLVELETVEREAEACKAAETVCAAALAELEQAEQAAWRRRRDAARSSYRAALAQLEQTEGSLVAAECRHLPDKLLMELRDCLRGLENSPLPPEPDSPPELTGLEAAALLDRAQQLQKSQLRRENREMTVLLAALMLVVGAGVAMRFWLRLGLLLLIPAMAALLSALCLWVWRKQHKPVNWIGEATRRWSWLNARDRREQAQEQRSAILRRMEELAPGLEPERLTADAVERLLTGGREAERELAQAELEYQAASAPLTPSPAVGKRREELARLRAQGQQLAERLRDLAQARSQVAQCRQELEQLRRREQAVLLAQEALEHAHDRLEQAYAPQVTQLAGEILTALTQGRYDSLVLEKDWQLRLRQRDTGLLRPLRTLSSGTQDQVWLALRLAMARLLLPADTPLILDDALLTFDEGRTRAAEEILKNENRQVILFSCR